MCTKTQLISYTIETSGINQLNFNPLSAMKKEEPSTVDIQLQDSYKNQTVFLLRHPNKSSKIYGENYHRPMPMTEISDNKPKNGHNSTTKMTQESYKLFLLGLTVLSCWILVMLFCGARKELFRRFLLKYSCCQPNGSVTANQSSRRGSQNYTGKKSPASSILQKTKRISSGSRKTNRTMKKPETLSSPLKPAPPSTMSGCVLQMRSSSRKRRSTSLKRRNSVQGSATQNRAEHRRAGQLIQMKILEPGNHHRCSSSSTTNNIIEYGNLINSLSGTSEPVWIIQDDADHKGNLLLCSQTPHRQILLSQLLSLREESSSSSSDGDVEIDNSGGGNVLTGIRSGFSRQSRKQKSRFNNNSGKLRRTKARAREESKVLYRNAASMRPPTGIPRENPSPDRTLSFRERRHNANRSRNSNDPTHRPLLFRHASFVSDSASGRTAAFSVVVPPSINSSFLRSNELSRSVKLRPSTAMPARSSTMSTALLPPPNPMIAAGSSNTSLPVDRSL